MADREKVIQHFSDCCYYAEAKHSGWVFARTDILAEAIALLKAQEPRVMTIEEIEQWNQPDVWMEKKDGEPDICGDYLAPMTRMQYGFWHAIIVDGSKHPPVLNGDYYGKEWRCWSARPTDEQREATAWDD